MNRQREMIEDLLKSLSVIESLDGLFDDSMERRLGVGEKGQQLLSWVGRVTSSLEAANMTRELRIWKRAVKGVPISSGSSLSAQMASLKAILVGFLEKFDRDGPSEELFPMEILEGTRNYIEKLAAQTNGCYQKGWYDACAVMVRRLIEILIIDCFEKHNIASKIKDADGNYYGLAQLIGLFLTENTWHISRPVRKYLPKLKDLKEIGDIAAHGRHLVTKKQIESLAKAVAYAFQGLVEIAYFQD
jgi:hypothetical protein